MTVMDIKSHAPVLTQDQANLAHGMRHTTLATLKQTVGECQYPVVALHYDLVETTARCLGIAGAALVAFRNLAKLPEDALPTSLD